MADFQPFLLVKAEQLLVIGAKPFPSQKEVDPIFRTGV